MIRRTFSETVLVMQTKYIVHESPEMQKKAWGIFHSVTNKWKPGPVFSSQQRIPYNNSAHKNHQQQSVSLYF